MSQSASSDGARRPLGGLRRREFLAASAAMVAPLAMPEILVKRPSPTAGAPRNIVVVITDDQRHDALGCAGHPFLDTPAIDRLAKNGARAKNAFVTTALCSPSRASMLTGLYAHSHGILDNQTLLPAATPVYPLLLQESGYETAYVGKWHMGGSTDEPRPGWDHWASFRGQGVYFDPRFNIDGTAKKFVGYTTDIISDLAATWLGDRGTKPFCLVVGHKAVHNPFSPAPRHAKLYADAAAPAPMPGDEAAYAGTQPWVRAQRRSWHGVDGTDGKGLWDGNYPDFAAFYRDYMRTIVAVDEGVGRIVQALEAKGLLDSTLILFTSDNGFLMGEHGLLDKRCMYEESIRIPLVVHCPDLIRPGRVLDEMILNIDYAPTILELAGVPRPPAMHGESFAPLLGNATVPWRQSFLYEYFFEASYPQTPTVLGVRTPSWKYMEFHGIWDPNDGRALYDLQKDPRESTNLAGRPESKETQATLSAELGRLLELHGARRSPTWRK